MNTNIDKRINEHEQKHRVIIPVSPNYVTNKTQIYGFEIPTVLFYVLMIWLGSTFILIRSAGIELGAVLSGIIGFIILIYASSHDQFNKTKYHLIYKLRSFFGYNKYTINNSSPQKLQALHIYEIKKYFPGGIIKLKSTDSSIIISITNYILTIFNLPPLSKERYGVIINCQTKQVDETQLEQQLIHISGFLNSLPDKSLTKIKVSSTVPYMNTVEKMTVKQITNAPDIDKDLLFSLHNMSKKGKKPNLFSIRIFISFISTDKKVETFFNTIWPGFKDRLAAISTIATIVSNRKIIDSIYASEFTKKQNQNQNQNQDQSNSEDSSPAIYNNNSIWNDKLRQFMQSSVTEHSEYVKVNEKEYQTCITVGTPKAGVAGFPPGISPELLSQLYRLSSGDEHTVDFTISIYPIPTYDSLRQISFLMKRLLKNDAALEGKEISQFDIGHSYAQLEALYGYVKDGKEKIYDINFIIKINSPTPELLDAGISEVSAVLNAHNVNNYIPINECLKYINATRFIPYYLSNSSFWLPTTVLSRIIPLVNGPAKVVSNEGMYFGNEINTNQEIVINLADLGASHCLNLGPTRSGKTSGMMLTAIRTVENNEDAIYVSDKKDQRTNVESVIRRLKEKAQLIQLGRQLSGETIHYINVFDIFHNTNLQFDPVTLFYEHVDFLSLFINILVGGDLTEVQKPYLNKKILQLYKEFNIVPYDTKTWSNPRPLLTNLYNLINDDFERNPTNSTAGAMVNRTERFNTTLLWLSNQTNISLNKQFTVIDLSNIHENYKKAINYMLIQLLRIRFDPNNTRHLRILIDEAGSLLQDKTLQVEVSRMLRQAGSFNIGVEIGSQDFAGLSMIGSELQSNIFITKIYGFNISKSVDTAIEFVKGTEADKRFLISCHKPGMMLLNVGHPFNQTYYVYQQMSPKEQEIIFNLNKQDTTIDSSYKFLSPELEQFAQSQRIIITDWIEGDVSDLRNNRTRVWEQRSVGTGKTWAFIDEEITDGSYVHINGSNQSIEHFFRVEHLAGYFISKKISIEVNHNNDADVVAKINDKLIAFEYQTSGDNDVKRLMTKIENNKNKYDYMFFIGNTSSVREITESIKSSNIVIPCGTQLESLIESLINKTHQIYKQDETNT